MDEEHGFFRVLTRVNSILFFILILCGLALVSFVAYKFYTDATSKRVVTNIINTQKAPTLKKKYELSSQSTFINETYLVTPLSLVQTYKHSYYSKNSSSIQNYLFTNINSSKSRWLLDTNEYMILNTSFITKDKYKTNPNGVKSLLIEFVKKDTNGDKRLSSQDKRSLAIAKIDGLEFTTIIDDLDILNTWQLLDETTLLILYQSKGIANSAKIDLKSFEIFDKKRIFLE